MKRQSISSRSGDVEQNPLMAIFLMTSAMLLLPVMDITAKYLSAELPTLEGHIRPIFLSASDQPCHCIGHRPPHAPEGQATGRELPARHSSGHGIALFSSLR